MTRPSTLPRLPSPERRLRRLAVMYVPVLASSIWLTLRYGVGARPGGDPIRDLAWKGTGLAPPLFLPAALFGAAALSGRRDVVGTMGSGLAGLIGLAFTAGSTLNLHNDIAAARYAGSPVGLTVGNAALHWVYGPALVIISFQCLRHRRRRPDGGAR